MEQERPIISIDQSSVPSGPEVERVDAEIRANAIKEKPIILHDQSGLEAEAAADIPTGEIIDTLRSLKDHGVDFEEEDIGHISAMDAEERVDYLFQALLEAGVEDPETVLKEKGILE